MWNKPRNRFKTNGRNYMNYAVWRFSSAGPASSRRVFVKFSACSPSSYFRMTGPTRRASQKQAKINQSLRTRFNAQAFLGEGPHENVTRRTQPKPTKASEAESESRVHSEVLIFWVFCVFVALSFWRFRRFRENLSDRQKRALYICYAVCLRRGCFANRTSKWNDLF